MTVIIPRRGDLQAAITASNNPPDYANMFAWHDASKVTGKSNGDQLSVWQDSKAGVWPVSNGNTDPGGPFGDQCPKWDTNVQGGLPGIRFDNTRNTFLKTAGSFNAGGGISAGNPVCSMYFVGRFTGASQSVSNRLVCHGQENAGIFYWSDKYGYYQVDGGNGNFGAFGIGPTTTAIFSLIYASSSSLSAYINGNLAFTGDPHDDYYGGAGVGHALHYGAQDGGHAFANCYMFEAQYYSGAHNSTMRGATQTWLNSKWAVY